MAVTRNQVQTVAGLLRRVIVIQDAASAQRAYAGDPLQDNDGDTTVDLTPGQIAVIAQRRIDILNQVKALVAAWVP